MNIFPAIDLYDGKAVRLYKGDYAQMNVYNNDPSAVAADFEACGAEYLHIVDLEGAKTGLTPNIDTVRKLVRRTRLFTEIGGGIRSMQTVETYLDAGVGRVILGTAAVTDESFLRRAVAEYGSRIAVGVDIRDGFVAVKGWTEKSELECFTFCDKLADIGVDTIICTDISKDGAMQGANHDLYRDLAARFKLRIIASGGVSSLQDVRELASIPLYGAIIGKAYYTGSIDLRRAIEVAK